MNNQICDILTKNKILLKKLETLDFAKYSKKRGYELFFGVDLQNYFTAIFFRIAKSKILRAELKILDEICDKLGAENQTNIKKRILFYNSPICSKVKADRSWKFYAFV